MTTGSLWLDEPFQALPRRRVCGRPEVAVVGGGVTGCSCALTLASAGLRVRLIEARAIASGASGRNGGFALGGLHVAYDEARERLGREVALRLWALCDRALDRMEELAGDAFRRTGSLRLAADDGERDALRQTAAALAEDGLDGEWVDDLGAALDGGYRGGIAYARGGAIHPARWVRRLARHAAEAGAEIVEGVPADPSSVEADAIVVAVDGFTASVLPELAGVVRPTRGQVLATAPLPEMRYPIPHYARGGYDYWQQLPDGSLVVGGCRDTALADEYVENEEPTPAVQRAIDGLAQRLVGRPVQVTHRWAGIWGTSPDDLPLVGRLPGRDGVWIAGGYSGHGNVLGLACGDLVARAILGERGPEVEPLDPARLLPQTAGG